MTEARTEPNASILERVRLACRDVTADATLVRVDPDRVRSFARELEPIGAPTDGPDPWSDGLDAAGSADAMAGLVLTLDTINFGSGYHPHVRKRPGCSGAVTMATAWRAWNADRTVSATALTEITAADAHAIFGQPSDDPALVELMALFATALRELGQLVATRYDSRFTSLVEDAGCRAARLAEILGTLPTFHDETVHAGRVVPFYKRAQLAAADLDRAFAGAGPGRFDDLDRLTAFADNLVPHVLRVEGVLRYDDDLAARIDRGELLASGSAAEIEIRAGGVHAVELLRDAYADRDIAVTSSDLDQLLWRRGGGPRFKAIPRHRTRSKFY